MLFPPWLDILSCVRFEQAHTVSHHAYLNVRGEFWHARFLKTVFHINPYHWPRAQTNPYRWRAGEDFLMVHPEMRMWMVLQRLLCQFPHGTHGARLSDLLDLCLGGHEDTPSFVVEERIAEPNLFINLRRLRMPEAWRELGHALLWRAKKLKREELIEVLSDGPTAFLDVALPQNDWCVHFCEKVRYDGIVFKTEFKMRKQLLDHATMCLHLLSFCVWTRKYTQNPNPPRIWLDP